MWMSDDIMNIMIKKYQDESGRNNSIHVMDTQFYTMLNWDPSKRKLVEYPVKSKKLFNKTNIFKLQHWVIPINTELHWFVIFVINPNKIV